MFKRIFAIIISMFTLPFGFILFTQQKPIFYDYAESFEICFDNGSFGTFITVEKDDFALYRRIKGESCYTTIDYIDLLKDFSAFTVFSEETVYGQSFYAFSPKIPYRASLKGKAVNIQYFIGDGYIKIGTPLIFGGY